MDVGKVFVSVNAADFAGLSEWWATLLERRWDREPMPSCHEWDLAGCALFQVLDSPDKAGQAVVTLHVGDLNAHVERLRSAGVDVPDPASVDGFDSLMLCQFADPEGNVVSLLEGA